MLIIEILSNNLKVFGSKIPNSLNMIAKTAKVPMPEGGEP